MKLNDAKLRNLTTPGKHSDGRGLYLEITPKGGRYWRLKFRFLGKENRLSFGTYPTVSLKAAREQRDAAKQLLAQGKDPAGVRNAAKSKAQADSVNTFETVAREWLTKTAAQRAPVTQKKVEAWLNKNVLPFIGRMPVASIRSVDILHRIVRRLESRNAIDTAHRINQLCSQILRFAVVTGRAENDVTANLKGALETKKKKHHAAITDPHVFGSLLRAIQTYNGHHSTVSALKLAPLVFVRPGELRKAEWSEINFNSAEWRIPGSKMKMANDHIVPLSTQALEILQSQFEMTGHGIFVFPSIRTGERPMSENTINAALRGLGFAADVHTAHGFRASARTILDEVLGERVDLIEHQLAHSVKDANGRAYNRTAHLPARKEMMQRWSDYLQSLQNGSAILQFAKLA